MLVYQRSFFPVKFELGLFNASKVSSFVFKKKLNFVKFSFFQSKLGGLFTNSSVKGRIFLMWSTLLFCL